MTERVGTVPPTVRRIAASIMLAFFVWPGIAAAADIHALNSVAIGGRTITEGEEVFKTELAPLNGNTDNYWTFNFDWPNFVQNQAALVMAFRGTFGNLEGGVPVDGVNYSYNLQQWPAGSNSIGKFIGLPPPKAPETTASTYTLMVAERDPNYFGQGIDQQALWFSSGGTQGIAPLKYSLLTFEFKADEPYPVIIVPGILGSAERHGQWVIDPILHVYDNLIDTFAANGYSREVNLFTFPYDWRQSNVDTALLLRDKINQVQGICHCKKVDLVAHSMGGLVARQYIQSSNYENDVGHLVFLGTPHLGAPVDYFMWEAGIAGKDFDSYSLILKIFLTAEGIEKGYGTLFQYIRDKPIPSVRELLPIYSYLFNENGSLRVYPNQYPTNTFLENLQSSSGALFSSGVQTTNIAGDNLLSNTISSIDVKASSLLPFWPDGMPIGLLKPLGDLGTHFGAGDKTVPFVSAASQFQDTLISNSDHKELPTNEETRVYNILTGKLPIIIKGKPVPKKILVTHILSPADLTIVAPDGKRIGRNGNQEINEIPGAFYSGFDTDTEFILIPDPMDGEYKISALGTGSGGAYTVVTNYVTEATSTEKSVTGTIAPNQVIASRVELTASSTDPLVVQGPDTEPPVITIQSPLAKEYLHSDVVPVQVSVTDADSGVTSSISSFDGAATTTSTLDLFFVTLGAHTFKVSATDSAGNATTSTVALSVVTTPDSTILDIERAYALKWIKNPATKLALIQKVKNAVKLKKQVSIVQEMILGKVSTKKVETIVPCLDLTLSVPLTRDMDLQLRSGNITQQAYTVIKADIEWLLHNI